mmetsp:Transcript_43256/g.50773  ORF Transcript_43256/g.50773 Transcript_43256/m.50773 type:complete len:117 (-) Transcript_43256:3035-3385(-)
MNSGSMYKYCICRMGMNTEYVEQRLNFLAIDPMRMITNISTSSRSLTRTLEDFGSKVHPPLGFIQNPGMHSSQSAIFGPLHFWHKSETQSRMKTLNFTEAVCSYVSVAINVRVKLP